MTLSGELKPVATIRPVSRRKVLKSRWACRSGGCWPRGA